MSAVASIPLISIAANVSSRARKDTNGSTAYSFLSIENILPASHKEGGLPWIRRGRKDGSPAEERGGRQQRRYPCVSVSVLLFYLPPESLSLLCVETGKQGTLQDGILKGILNPSPIHLTAIYGLPKRISLNRKEGEGSWGNRSVDCPVELV